MKPLEKSCIIIELTTERLIAVEVIARGHNFELLRYSVRQAPTSGVTVAWIRSLWNEEHFSHNRVVSILPVGLVKYKTLNLPNLPSEQLWAAARFELENLNGNSESVFQIINCQRQTQVCQVKVALINNEDLTAEFTLLSQAGLELQWSGLRSRGILNFISYNKGFFSDNLEPVAYLDLTANETEYGIVNETEIVCCRNFGIGSQDLLSEDGAAAKIDFAEELRLSMAASRGLGAVAPQKLWLFGKPEAVMGPVREVAADLGLDLLEAKKSGLSGVLTDQATPELAPLIGLALGANGLNDETEWRIYSRLQSLLQKKREQIWVGIEVGILLSLLIVGVSLGIQASAKRQAKISLWLNSKADRIVELRRTEQETRQKIAQMKEMAAWMNTSGRELEFLVALEQVLPTSTRITDLTIEDGVVKDLSGITPSVSQLMKTISKDDRLEQLRLKGTIAVTPEGEIFHLEGPISGKDSKR